MSKGKHYTADEVNAIVSMLGRGRSSAEIAEGLGRDRHSVQVRISRLRKQVGPVREIKKREVVEQPEQVNEGVSSVNFLSGAVVGALIGAALVWILV